MTLTDYGALGIDHDDHLHVYQMDHRTGEDSILEVNQSGIVDKHPVPSGGLRTHRDAREWQRWIGDVLELDLDPMGVSA